MGSDRNPLSDRVYHGGIIAMGEYVDLSTRSLYFRCWILNFTKGFIAFNRGCQQITKTPKLD